MSPTNLWLHPKLEPLGPAETLTPNLWYTPDKNTEI